MSRVALFVSLQSLLLHGSLPEDEQDVSLDSGDAEQQLVTFGSFVWVSLIFLKLVSSQFVFSADQLLLAARVCVCVCVRG